METDIFDDGALSREFLRSKGDLIRSSLKRSLDVFIGNARLRSSKLWEVPEPRERRIKIKRDDEYSLFFDARSSEQPEAALGAIPGAPPRPSSRRADNTGALQLVRPDVAAMMPAAAPLISEGAAIARMPTSAGASSQALAHLTFKVPMKGIKVTQHPKWELMRVISGHHGWVRCLAVDPSNEWFASGGNDRLLKIWDLATGTLKLSLTGHINTIRALQISARHPYLFSCGEDQMVKCWDLEYNRVVRHYHGHLSGVYSMTLHPTLDVLATGGRDAVIRVWDIRTKRAIHVLAGHSGTVMSLASQRVEPQLISGSVDKMVRCWDLAAGRTAVVLTHHKKAARALAVHPKEYTFCSAAADHVKVWRCPKAQFERNVEAVGSILNAVAIKDDPDSAVLIGGGDQGHLYFWDWNSGKKFQTLESIPQPGSLSSERAIFDVKLDQSETRLLTAECDKTIKVWRECGT